MSNEFLTVNPFKKIQDETENKKKDNLFTPNIDEDTDKLEYETGFPDWTILPPNQVITRKGVK